jgi:hypothetical protein
MVCQLRSHRRSGVCSLSLLRTSEVAKGRLTLYNKNKEKKPSNKEKKDNIPSKKKDIGELRK